MLSFFRRLMADDKAATAIEYTLIASLIAVAAITAISTVSGKNVSGRTLVRWQRTRCVPTRDRDERQISRSAWPMARSRQNDPTGPQE